MKNLGKGTFSVPFKIKWYFNRLSLMSPMEVLHRFKNTLVIDFDEKKAKPFTKINNFIIDEFKPQNQKFDEVKKDLDFLLYEDIRSIWEYNRFQHFYYIPAEEIESQLTDWLEKNPYLQGVNWTSSLELALRIISWSWGLCYLESINYKLPKELTNKVGKSIYLQAQYISRHLSAYSSANNHLIGEAAGLVFAGCVFDFGKDSKKFVNRGFKILTQEIEKQVFNDGMSKEQTLGYHCFVHDFFYYSFLVMEKNGYKVPEKHWKKLKKMQEVLALFSDDEGNIPNIGDNDDAMVLPLDRSSSDQAKSSKYLEDSGYVLFKDTNTNAFIDIGPLGYLSIAAHGHADTLSFCLNYKNREFLCDPGTYTYHHAGQEWRDYFRGTSTHNTVTVDNQNSSKIAGPFMWLKKAEPKIEEVTLDTNIERVTAWHNGYLKQGIKVKHQRKVLFQKDKFFVVRDDLYNLDKKEHLFALNWHTGLGCELEPIKNGYKITNAGEKILIRIFSPGNTKLIPGWISKKFYRKESISVINTEVLSDKDAYFITVISPVSE